MYLSKYAASKFLPDDHKSPNVNQFVNLKKPTPTDISQDLDLNLDFIQRIERKLEEDEIHRQELVEEVEGLGLDDKSREVDEKPEKLNPKWMQELAQYQYRPKSGFTRSKSKNTNFRREALKMGVIQPFSSLASWERADKLADFTEHRLGPKYSRMIESKNDLNEFVRNQFQKIEEKTNYYQKWREEMQAKKLEEISRREKEREAEELEKIRCAEEVKRKRLEKLNLIVDMTRTLNEINRMDQESGDGPRNFSKPLPYALKFDWDRTLNFESDFDIEEKKSKEKFELTGVTSLKESKYQPRLPTPKLDYSYKIYKLRFNERLYTFDLRPGKIVSVFNKSAGDGSGDKSIAQIWPNRGVYEIQDGIKVVISNSQISKYVSVRINISKFIRDSVKVKIIRPGRLRFVSRFAHRNDECLTLDFLVSRSTKDKHINPTISRFDMFSFDCNVI